MGMEPAEKTRVWMLINPVLTMCEMEKEYWYNLNMKCSP
jgi:hypothetical protein